MAETLTKCPLRRVVLEHRNCFAFAVCKELASLGEIFDKVRRNCANARLHVTKKMGKHEFHLYYTGLITEL